MDAVIQSSIIAASAVLLGGILSGLITHSITRMSIRSQLERDMAVKRMDALEERKKWFRERLEKAHQIATRVGLEYSLTGFLISWRLKPGPTEIDKKYLATNELVSELWVIADSVSSKMGNDVHELRGELNCFHGHFQEMMRCESSGQEITHETPSFRDCHKYAEQAYARAASLRESIGEELRKLRTV